MTVLSHVQFSVDGLASTESKHLDAGSGRLAMAKLCNLAESLAGGRNTGSAKFYYDAVKATGTLTLASSVATDTCSINGTTFTCVASGATGNQWNVGASDTLSAVALAAAINASATALVNKHVVATSSEAVVTLTAVDAGNNGNAITIAGNAQITASGARLTGGSNGATSSATFTF